MDYRLMMPLITEFGMEDWMILDIMKGIRKLERVNEALHTRENGYPYFPLTEFLESMIPAFAKLNRESTRNEVDDDYMERDRIRDFFLSNMNDREAIEKLLMRKLELPKK